MEPLYLNNVSVFVDFHSWIFLLLNVADCTIDHEWGVPPVYNSRNMVQFCLPNLPSYILSNSRNMVQFCLPNLPSYILSNPRNMVQFYWPSLPSLAAVRWLTRIHSEIYFNEQDWSQHCCYLDTDWLEKINSISCFEFQHLWTWYHGICNTSTEYFNIKTTEICRLQTKTSSFLYISLH